MNSGAEPLGAFVLVVIGLGVVYLVLLGGFRVRSRGVVAVSDVPGGWQSIGGGLTVALAVQVVFGVFTTPSGGVSGTDVSIGAVSGVLYGAAASGSVGLGSMARLLGRAVEVAVGVVALVPTTIAFFGPGAGCGVSSQPLWVSALVFGCIVLALAASVLLSVLRAATGRLTALLNADVALAYFGAVELCAFFVAPFGLQLIDLPRLGWLASLIGVVLVALACVLSPGLVVSVAGVVLAGATIAVDTTEGEACQVRSFGGLGLLIAYVVVVAVTRALVGARRRVIRLR